MKLHTSTAYHPQSNGQTKQVNQELEQYLHLFCNKQQYNWDELLPDVEFQYNNHIHAITQFSPFFLDPGHHSCMGFKPHAHPSDNQAVNEFMDKMGVAQEEVKVALAKAKDHMAHYYDHGHTPALKYQPGNHVYLNTLNITMTQPLQKLLHCHLGPF